MRGREGQVWECHIKWTGERELHLVVRDRGETLDNGSEPIVTLLDLERGTLDHEAAKWLDLAEGGSEGLGWRRVC